MRGQGVSGTRRNKRSRAVTLTGGAIMSARQKIKIARCARGDRTRDLLSTSVHGCADQMG